MQEHISNSRIAKLINVFAEAKRSMTSKELAAYIGVSSHTIRNDMKEVETLLCRHGAAIEGKPRVGYALQILNETAWHKFYQQLMLEQKNSLHEPCGKIVPTGRKDRIDYIISNLLVLALRKEQLSQWDLADKLYISLSTLKSYWKDIQQVLSGIGIALIADRGNKIRLEGDENRIRRCIAEKLFSQDNLLDLSTSNFYQEVFSQEEIKRVKDIVLKAILSHDIVLSDMAFRGIVLHILIVLKRFGNAATIEYSAEELKFLRTTESYGVVREIVEEIHKEMSFNIETEEYYLTEHFLSSQRFLRDEKRSDRDESANGLVWYILGEIRSEYHIDLSHDRELIAGLQIHLNAAIHRLRFNIGIRNDILQVIKKSFPLAFELAVLAARIIETQENLKTNENEIGFLAMHFGVALDRKAHKKKSCILVCGAGAATAMLMKEILLRRFGGYLDIVRICPLYELRQTDLDDVDLIFSTVMITSFQSKKIVYVSPVLTEDDITRLEGRIVCNKLKADVEAYQDFFHENLFFKGITLDSKEEILCFLSEQMLAQGYIDERTQASIFAREKMASTEIGGLIAMPHAIENTSSVPAVAVAILQKSIRWAYENVQLVFMISIPQNKCKLWEDIFKRIYQYLVRDKGIHELIAKQDYHILLARLFHVNIERESHRME